MEKIAYHSRVDFYSKVLINVFSNARPQSKVLAINPPIAISYKQNGSVPLARLKLSLKKE
jgi:hypothetical protein